MRNLKNLIRKILVILTNEIINFLFNRRIGSISDLEPHFESLYNHFCLKDNLSGIFRIKFRKYN